MKKPQSLYTFLLDSCPELKRDPTRISMQVVDGNLVTRQGDNLGFEMRYRVNILVLGLTEHIHSVLLPVMIWIRTNQIDLLQNHDKADNALAFEVDILDRSTYDLSIELPLTEAIDVRRHPNGVYRMTERGEPPQCGMEGDEGLALLPEDIVLIVNDYGELRLHPDGSVMTKDPNAPA
ncbi:hypothetical protein ABAC460_10255 [Asticcacaulis sp. AC460]|uniref:phage tail protein n=1 Tax=Asticcacaulis sp. AC460 TaxID=1282360 RepID=UPI0003C3D71E|nr:phage tail protein [Asticcacaulis sp. AC460]ESQ90130.1 hypothetical protein ABAC460_10255 [Asticcacaulis sp. AC460]